MKISVSVKVALFILAAAMAFIGMVTLSGYNNVLDSLCKAAGESNVVMARLLANSISETIARETDNGKASVGNAVFDEAAKSWVLPLTVPEKNEASEAAPGYGASIDIATLCKPLENFKTGNTGVAALVDERVYLICYPGAKMFANKFCEYSELQKILRSRSGWARVDSAYLHDKGAIASFAAVESKILARSGMVWRVFIVQNSGEVLAPARAFVRNMLILAAIIILLTAAEGFGFGRIFARPIKAMVEGVKKLGAGDLDFRVKPVKTGDEMETFMTSFDKMADKVKDLVRDTSKEKSELEKKEKDFIKFEGMKTDFTHALCSLSANADALKREVRSAMDEKPSTLSPKDKSRLTAISDGVARLSHVIGNMMDLAKIDTCRMDLQRKNIDIREILKPLIFSFEPKIREKGLNLKTTLPKEAANVYVDPDRIGKALNTLIDNAMKFTDKGGIEIEIKDKKTEVEVAVSDTGTGIPSTSIYKIFERSSYAAPGASSKAGGHSFNLVLANEIIQIHGGRIWAESTPGKLTKFTFLLPKGKA